MELTEKPVAYLNTAGCGLLSEAGLVEAGNIYQAFTRNSSGRAEDWRANEDSAVHELVAEFMDVPVETIGFIPNFSYAMNVIALSLSGKERVLLYKDDYPSVYEPFVRRKFDIEWLASTDGFGIALSAVEEALAGRQIDIVAISHVQWKTGFQLNLHILAGLCHKYGAKLILDATQSLGAIQLDIVELGIDVVIASNYKWMNSGFGNGIICIQASFLEDYPQAIVGANTLDQVNSARSFEPGGLNIYGLALLQNAIREKMEFGLPEITNHNMRLTQTLLNGLARLKDHIKIIGDYSIDRRSSIVVLMDQHKSALAADNNDGSLGAWLEHHHKIIVTRRGGTLRVSIHYYNTADEVQSLLEALSAWVGLG